MAVDVRSLFDLSGKVALITGASRGIGKTIAQTYGAAGAKLAITGRREQWLTPTKAEFSETGFDCRAILADVARAEEVDRTVAECLTAFGRIDILVNNAGQSWGQAAEEMPLEKWRQILDVNLTGMFLMSQRVGRHMIERGGGGRIINIASVAGVAGGYPEVAKTIAYNVSKAGVIALTKNLAREWGPYGILTNAIAPGWFSTRMAAAVIDAHRLLFETRTPLGRVGELEDLRGVALFLAAPASAYVTGQTIVVDGGLTL